MYKLKHKATGLYYRPAGTGSNLSLTGKVYHRKPAIQTWLTLRFYHWPSKPKKLSALHQLCITAFSLPLDANYKYSHLSERFKIKTHVNDWEIEELKLKDK